MSIVANKLPNLINEEYDPVVRAFAVQIFLYSLGKAFNGKAEFVFGFFEPGFRRLSFHSQGFG